MVTETTTEMVIETTTEITERVVTRVTITKEENLKNTKRRIPKMKEWTGNNPTRMIAEVDKEVVEVN